MARASGEPNIFAGVQDAYQRVAEKGGHQRDGLMQEALMMGYTQDDLEVAPLMGLGCGNPLSFAELQQGESVMDLGCGGGFDCFLAARRVGRTGHVIGVDMTPEMLRKASMAWAGLRLRCSASAAGRGPRLREVSVLRARALQRERLETNVSFRLGEVEHLPCADSCVDVIISNGVICLCLDQRQVFREAFRVLRPGGRIAVCDMVLKDELPQELKTSQAFSS